MKSNSRDPCNIHNSHLKLILKPINFFYIYKNCLITIKDVL